jgi:hypothetical protein
MLILAGYYHDHLHWFFVNYVWLKFSLSFMGGILLCLLWIAILIMLFDPLYAEMKKKKNQG